ncbi:hypothetical protein K1719_000346 [Acacia pycnantha]|nr:hypothetical protein K1719_000346 [Acacia pycnantha]
MVRVKMMIDQLNELGITMDDVTKYRKHMSTIRQYGRDGRSKCKTKDVYDDVSKKRKAHSEVDSDSLSESSDLQKKQKTNNKEEDNREEDKTRAKFYKKLKKVQQRLNVVPEAKADFNQSKLEDYNIIKDEATKLGGLFGQALDNKLGMMHDKLKTEIGAISSMQGHLQAQIGAIEAHVARVKSRMREIVLDFNELCKLIHLYAIEFRDFASFKVGEYHGAGPLRKPPSDPVVDVGHQGHVSAGTSPEADSKIDEEVVHGKEGVDDNVTGSSIDEEGVADKEDDDNVTGSSTYEEAVATKEDDDEHVTTTSTDEEAVAVKEDVDDDVTGSSTSEEDDDEDLVAT